MHLAFTPSYRPATSPIRPRTFAGDHTKLAYINNVVQANLDRLQTPVLLSENNDGHYLQVNDNKFMWWGNEEQPRKIYLNLTTGETWIDDYEPIYQSGYYNEGIKKLKDLQFSDDDIKRLMRLHNNTSDIGIQESIASLMKLAIHKGELNPLSS